MSIPSVEDVKRTSFISDPVIRNLNITQCYYELSLAMKELHIKPSWCTFATWASKQAGQSIRKEDLTKAFENNFRESPEILFILEKAVENFGTIKELTEIKPITESILKLINPDKVFNKTADAVAIGNRKVFEEIGREFARFLTFFNAENSFNRNNLKSFCEELNPGEPPEGQQLLKEAFTAYFESWQLEDPKLKCEMIHYANLLIGFHEQTRLQPEIVEAMNAPLKDIDNLRYKIFKLFLPGFWLRIRYFISKIFNLRLPFDLLLDEILENAKQQVRKVITENFMTLYVPGYEMLRLGKNLQMKFPTSLQQITNEKLIDLLIKIDPTKDSLEESGAEDWGDFKERIHFIADFFRCFYEHNELFESPFSKEQAAIIKQGRLPSGNL